MSILANRDTRVVIIGGVAGLNAARRMAQFDFLVNRPLSVQAFVYPPEEGQQKEIYRGGELKNVPVYSSLEEALAENPGINTALIYIGANRAYTAAKEAIEASGIKLVSMITEGVPEKDAKRLRKLANTNGKLFNGPSSIGIMSAGECRLGVIGGEFKNLKLCNLYRPGSFGVITKSGGLSNEAMWLCAQNGNGVTTAVAIGGDAYPGTDFVTYLEMFENDPDTKAVVIVGEVGGTLEDEAAEWLAAEKRRIRLIATIGGTCQEVLPQGMKFGHAGAKEGKKGVGSARAKMNALRDAGALVPDTFGGLSKCIKQVYEELLADGSIKPEQEIDEALLPELPLKVQEIMKQGEVIVEPLIRTTISDDRGEEPRYVGYAASELCEKGYGIEDVVSLLWNKKLPSREESEIIKRIIMISADHGPAVSGAFGAIIGACAGIDMPQAVSAGMTMIGPRFGGAVTNAGKYFKYGVKEFPNDIPGFLSWMKQNVGPVPGIGHRVKSVKNPDKRVKYLVDYVKNQTTLHSPCLDYALEVEKLTTSKKDNLILNVDGTIGCVLVDLDFPEQSMNGFFVLARTIGMIGHWIDQNSQSSKLIRLYDYLINYAVKEEREVPEKK
ncbi:MAG: ATP citrate lyase [Chlorobium sp.]|uniref:citrate/2-methylcitrate synthase n=1 Tax=Chlorobium sp. TaxID=1095 RepID=UPI0025C2FF8E|nr:citrate/2-methylcitrate synthase [Chlorobium sp.]MCF8216789.1 ATP citrate lyase [Chlorobium sp.]MCF8271540.1 ATP citrate lyase [Chlorobium sp.]MCF8287912.1 ATP citrate lyase [Chlorobium sp.]MCF8291590.1 ATP citrate lyase [Chlorobium sp.]MCF8385581.1 ATP citrate lyase [Chlorobium sp.]